MTYGKEAKEHLGGYIIGGDYHTFAFEVWDWMISNNIKSILDIGCGEGHSTKYFLDRGCDVLGIEGGQNAINNSSVKNNIVCHDYTLGPYIPSKKYDAVWCCEFVEHVEDKYVDNFLKTFSYADNIFMTHAIPNQAGYHHVNCQKDTYWIEKLNQIGFEYDQDKSIFLRNLTNKYHIHDRLLFFYKKS